MCSSRFATTQKTVKNHKTKKPPKLPPQALLILDVFSQNQGTADVAQQGAAFFFRKKNTTEGRGEDSKGEKLCFGLFSFNPKGGREVPSPKSQISPAVFRGVPLVLFFLSLRLHFFFPKRNLTWNMSFTIPIPPQKK